MERLMHLERKHQLEHFTQSPQLSAIFCRSACFSSVRKSVKRHAFHGKCIQCKDLKENEKCIQQIYVNKTPIDKDLLGCGVSMAPEGEQMRPLPVSLKNYCEEFLY